MGAGRDRCRGRFAPRRGVSQAASHGFCKRPSAPRTAASNLGSSTAPTLKRAHADLALPGLQRHVAVTDRTCGLLRLLAAIASIILKAKFCGEWLISGLLAVRSRLHPSKTLVTLYQSLRGADRLETASRHRMYTHILHVAVSRDAVGSDAADVRKASRVAVPLTRPIIGLGRGDPEGDGTYVLAPIMCEISVPAFSTAGSHSLMEAGRKRSLGPEMPVEAIALP